MTLFLSGLQSRASFMEESWCSFLHGNSGGSLKVANRGLWDHLLLLTYLLLWEVVDSVTHSSGRRGRQHAHFLERIVCCCNVTIFLVLQQSRGYMEGYSFTDCPRESISVNWICLSTDGKKKYSPCTLPIVFLLHACWWTQDLGEPWLICDFAFPIAEATKWMQWIVELWMLIFGHVSLTLEEKVCVMVWR